LSVLQLFDPASSTYTYVLWDPVTHEAVLIDGVLEQLERDLAHVERLGLKLAYTLDTHVHADHVTSAGMLRQRTGSRVALPVGHGSIGVDVDLVHRAQLRFGSETITTLLTPGHTASSASYLWRDAVFTGDALMTVLDFLRLYRFASQSRCLQLPKRRSC
jgi:glyoxylase-like metal-dependent hydrolase (beta-lactamase superfamily II)